MPFCLLPNKLGEFKTALKEKKVSLEDLVSLDHDALIKKLEPFAGRNASDIALEIEKKLILKNRLLGLQTVIGKLTKEGRYSPEKQAEIKKAVEDYKAKQNERIFSPKENESYLGGLAAKILGTEIPREAAQKVFQMTKEMDAVKEVNPTRAGVSNEYLKMKANLNKYVASFKPLSIFSSIGRNIVTFGRNSLIANPATPIKSSIGQLENFITNKLLNVVQERNLHGANPELAKSLLKEQRQTFQEVNINTAGMHDMNDTHIMSKGENFRVPDETLRKAGVVEKTIRNVSSAFNKVVIDWMHNKTFTFFHQKAFCDSLDFITTNLAKTEKIKGLELKTRAAEIFNDAARIEPQTEEGIMARNEAQKQAAWVTSTNENIASQLALSIKNGLNKLTPGFPLGDLLMPIAKIPATIVYNSLEASGLGLPKGVMDIFEGKKLMQSENLTERYQGMIKFSNGIRMLGKVTTGVGLGFLLASQLKKSDFRKDNYGRNFVKIGNLWINTEYISLISPSLAGAMAYKQTGNAGNYFIGGSLASLSLIPGTTEVKDFFNSFSGSSTKKAIPGLIKYFSGELTSRSVPAFINSLVNNRQLNRLLFGAQGVETEKQYKQEAAQKKKPDIIKRSENIIQGKTPLDFNPL